MIPPYGRKWRGAKKPLDESERGEWKSWLKAQHSENIDHGIWSHHFMGNRWGNSGNSVRVYFWGLQNNCSHEIKRCLLLGRKVMTNLDNILKSRDIILPTKVHLVKAMVFGVKLKTLESPFDSKEIQPVSPQGNQPWIFTHWRTVAEAEAPIFWSPDVNSQLIGKDPDAGKDWRQKEKRASEDEMAG